MRLAGCASAGMSAEIALQRVEEEVRLQLHLERLQPRLGQPGCQPLRRTLALAVAP